MQMPARPQHPVLVVVGTRPELIKLAPVIRELQRRDVAHRVVFTAQHRDLLDQLAADLDVSGHVDLDLMRAGQSLDELLARVVTGVGKVVEAESASAVVVQGDTTTVLGAAMAAFHHRVPVVHVEAGLRTGDLYSPFPEEANRKLVGQIARLHFAPTEAAHAELLREGVRPADIEVVGNTAIDAVLAMAECLDDVTTDDGEVELLVTMHRRENLGEPLKEVVRALRGILDARPNVRLTWPVHPNPAVKEVAVAGLGDHPRARIVPPMSYSELVGAMKRTTLLLTDSGGLQEEAAALDVPVLVLRDTTERAEALATGAARLVGTRAHAVRAHVDSLLDDAGALEAMRAAENPFGDGTAAVRIVERMCSTLGLSTAPCSPMTTRRSDRAHLQAVIAGLAIA